VKLTLTQKQNEFVQATADEVLFGGAAGGGKSYAQLIDAMLYALKYNGSKQLMLRRTFPELRRSLVLNSLIMYPAELAKYTESIKKWTFINGSSIEFGYCDSENDVNQYQSAEYDCVRFDELTHFTEFMYTYLISRIRGVNNFPKQIKSTTNPGSEGHSWVKSRFIDVAQPMTTFKDANSRTRIFIPASVYENKFLMDSDPEYIRRLEQLPEFERKTLLLGEWNVFAGQYFTEFNTSVHVCEPFVIPDNWTKYRALDYGLDMLACIWFAVSPQNKVYAYKELHEKDLIISEAAKRIRQVNGRDKISETYAPGDLWGRTKDSGKTIVETFKEHGVKFTKTSNDRVKGWMAVKEYLKVNATRDMFTGDTVESSDLTIFSNCTTLIKNLPQIQRSESNPNDCASKPHDITHICDALRYYCVNRYADYEEVRKEVVEEYDVYVDEMTSW
jgi:phage terminase large subunit